MACNCGKNKTAPTGSTASRQAAQVAANKTTDQAAAARARAANPSTARIGQASVGRTQSFSLRAGDGSTQTFGSALEARAARARAGGEIIPG